MRQEEDYEQGVLRVLKPDLLQCVRNNLVGQKVNEMNKKKLVQIWSKHILCRPVLKKIF